jgi:hypothetical protein
VTSTSTTRWWWIYVDVYVVFAPYMLDILEVEAFVGFEAAREILALERRGTGTLYVNVQLNRQLLDQQRDDAAYRLVTFGWPHDLQHPRS